MLNEATTCQLRCVMALTSFLWLFAEVAGGFEHEVPVTTGTQPFLLTSAGTMPEGSFSYEISGELRWLGRSADSWEYELRYKNATVQANLTLPNSPVSRLSQLVPFAARVVVSPSRDVPVEMEVVEGKVDRAKDEYGLGTQYDLVFLVSDTLLLTAVRRSVETVQSKKMGTQVSLEVSYPEQMKTVELGKVRASIYRDQEIPATFALYPHCGGRTPRLSDLTCLEFNKLGCAYHYRLADMATGVVSYAVNFQGVLKEETSAPNYTGWLDLIHNRMGFSSYVFNELKIVEVE